MRKFTLLLTMMVACHLNAQTPRSISSLSKDELLLASHINEQDDKRELRINQFLISNLGKERVVIQDGVTYVLYDILDGNPIYRTLDNAIASRATKTNRLNPGGALGLNLQGTNKYIAVWDGGPVQFDHTEFLDNQGLPIRVTNFETINTDGGSALSDHGTHVTGTIAARGANPEAKGMAPNVNVITYNFNNDMPEIVSVQNSFENIYISNHSYGVPVQGSNGLLDSWVMGAYTSDARDLDMIAATYRDYLIVASAGNSGNTTYPGGLFPGFDKLTFDKVAKNTLVVANADASFVSNQLRYPINTSSSQGPSDDLRIKPDIAGDGTNLLSPIPNSTYGYSTGTSMASPNVAGSLLLLHEYYEQLNGTIMKAATLKGLACHTALDDVQNYGPDPYFGWGLLDAEFAAQTITNDSNGSALISELNLSNGGTYSMTFNAGTGGPIIATICWTDIPGIPVANNDLNNTTPRLINDLDIRITKDGTTYLPWYLFYDQSLGFIGLQGDNNRDNVERINIEVPSSGIYTLTVSHKGTLQGFNGGPQSQDYSLILTGNNLTLGTNEFELAGIDIWPNPVQNQLNIKFKEVAEREISIYDIHGRKVYDSTINTKNIGLRHSIDTSGLSSGIYMLNLIEGNRVMNKKIIVQ